MLARLSLGSEGPLRPVNIVVALIIAALLAPACAEEWPTKPVKIVVAFGAGGSADIL